MVQAHAMKHALMCSLRKSSQARTMTDGTSWCAFHQGEKVTSISDKKCHFIFEKRNLGKIHKSLVFRGVFFQVSSSIRNMINISRIGSTRDYFAWKDPRTRSGHSTCDFKLIWTFVADFCAFNKVWKALFEHKVDREWPWWAPWYVWNTEKV